MLDYRRIDVGTLWVAGIRASCQDLPSEYGPWESIYSRYRRLRPADIWERIIKAFQQPPGSRSCSIIVH